MNNKRSEKIANDNRKDIINHTMKPVLVVKSIIACLMSFILLFTLSGCARDQLSIKNKENKDVVVATPCIEEENKKADEENTSGNYVKYIVLHDTEVDGTGENIASSWDNSNEGYVAAHFVIARDGSITQCVPLNKIAHHAGFGGDNNGANYDEKYGVGNNDKQGTGDDLLGQKTDGNWAGYTSYGMNSFSIGIEMIHVGTTHNDYPTAQLEAVDKVIAYIDSQTDKPEIIDHKDWRPGNSDTSPQFDQYLSQYKSSRTHDGSAQPNPANESDFGKHESAKFQHGDLPLKASGSSNSSEPTRATSGKNANQTSSNPRSSKNPDKATLTKSAKPRVSGASKEKDGYKIPGDYIKDNNYNGQNWSLSDDERGKGLFGSEDCETTPGDDSYSWDHYEVNARWEYISWSVTKGEWSGHATHANGPGSADGFGSYTSSADDEQYAWTYKQHVLVYNPDNGKAVVCTAGMPEIQNPNWGGDPLDCVGGLSYKAQEALGFKVETNGRCLDGGDYDSNCHDSKIEMEMWWVPEDTPLGPCDINEMQDNSENCGDDTTTKKVGSGVEGAVEWAEMVAQDDHVGYSQCSCGRAAGKGRESVKDYDGTTDVNVDCSALVYYSLLIGGGFTELEEVCSYPFATGGMDEALSKIGWVKHELVNPDEVQRGDILWRSGHTGWCTGPGTTCEASGREPPKDYCVHGFPIGAPGDQFQRDGNGEEVFPTSSDKIKGFTHYYRKEQ